MGKTWRNSMKHAAEIVAMLEENAEIIIFDTETVGLKKDAKIIQFSAVRFRIGKVGGKYTLTETGMLDRYLNPEELLRPKITDLTGITDEMLATAKTERQAAGEIFDFLYSADLWAAYNKSFDLSKVYHMAQRTDIHYLEPDTIDVLEMARDCIPKEEVENHKLGTVYGYLFPDQTVQFHSSIEDVRATAKCMERFLQMYQEETQSEDRVKVYLEWASFFVNPKAPSQRRIRLKLPEGFGEYGDIFYDVFKHCWSSKTSSKAKKLFEKVDLADLERQVLSRYGWRYQAFDMDTLAKRWGADKKQKAADRKESVS